MTVYLDRKVVEKNIGIEPSAHVSPNPSTGDGSIQVGAHPKVKMRRAHAPSRLLAIGGASLLVTLCLLMAPLVGEAKQFLPPIRWRMSMRSLLTPPSWTFR